MEGFSEEEVLLLADSLDQASRHPIAQAIVTEARARGMMIVTPKTVAETPGEGVAGRVGRRTVVVGGTNFVDARVGNTAGAASALQAGSVLVAVGVDGKLAGRILMADALRAGTVDFLAAARRLNVARILLATGDRQAVATAITEGLGLDGVRADLTPDQKVLLVLSEGKNGPVMMVGDGVNDAPALAASDLGVAMGARGAAASSEAADVVLLVDRLDRLLTGMEIAQDARRIALESVFAGIGLSFCRNDRSGLGVHNPGPGGIAARGDRRGGDLECAAGIAHCAKGKRRRRGLSVALPDTRLLTARSGAQRGADQDFAVASADARTRVP